MMRRVCDQSGSTLVMVLLVVLFMTVMASGLFWQLTRSLPRRMARAEALEHRLVLAHVTFEQLNAFLENPVAVQDFTLVPGHEDFEYRVFEEADSWVFVVRGKTVLPCHHWTVRVAILENQGGYRILAQGMVIDDGA